MLITSSTANRARSHAAIAAHDAPAAAPESSAATSVNTPPDRNAKAVAVAAAAPTRNWPSTPMLKTPAPNAHATARPVRISGMARTSVAENTAYCDPNAPRNNAVAAARTSAPTTEIKIDDAQIVIAMAMTTTIHRGSRVGDKREEVRDTSYCDRRTFTSLRMDQTPAAGPSASIGNAHFHPAAPTSGGTS